MKVEIIVTYRFGGVHWWPDAPADVAFLRFPHRHTFTVRLGIPVRREVDRQREFFIEQQSLGEAISRLFGEDAAGCSVCTAGADVPYPVLGENDAVEPNVVSNLGDCAGLDLGESSCETIAQAILVELPHAGWCEVWEDGDLGARVERRL